ncbi:MAG: DUF2069 domain-containing protein [Neisseriaceae bacterium]|nr:DUF2069 domain-containing protein [Neisseriaceae bacterium]
MFFLFALMILILLWEWKIAPLRSGGSWLMAKALPLSLFVSGCLKGRIRTMQKLSLLIPFYMAEAIMRLTDLSHISKICAAFELIFSISLFISVLLFIRTRRSEIQAA